MTSHAVVELEAGVEVRRLMNELLGVEAQRRGERVREERFRSLALAELLVAEGGPDLPRLLRAGADRGGARGLPEGGPGWERRGEGGPGVDGPHAPDHGDPQQALNRLFRCHEGPDELADLIG